jgi:transcriptional regulator of acetoin/glycerol metabolism
LLDRLQFLIDEASKLARAADLDQARAGAAAFEIGSRLRHAAARDPKIAAAVDEALAICWLLGAVDEKPSRDPDTKQKISNAALREALNSTRSDTAAARKLRCSRQTIWRRKKELRMRNIRN